MNQDDRDRFIKLETKVEIIEEDTNAIKESSVSIEKKFDKVIFHLFGDEDAHTKGMIEKQESYEVRLSKLEKVYLFVGLPLGIVMMFRDKIIGIFTI